MIGCFAIPLNKHVNIVLVGLNILTSRSLGISDINLFLVLQISLCQGLNFFSCMPMQASHVFV